MIRIQPTGGLVKRHSNPETVDPMVQEKDIIGTRCNGGITVKIFSTGIFIGTGKIPDENPVLHLIIRGNHNPVAVYHSVNLKEPGKIPVSITLLTKFKSMTRMLA